ncbi:MAG: carbohydrate binding domain-containing protein [Dehalococcoidia bacterium]|nr:carbohydrate binding domain-containing protein [Dehalococcoidia bacterium]
MPVIGWLIGKAMIAAGGILVYGPLVLGVGLTIYAGVAVGKGIADAAGGARDASRAARTVEDASPAELEELQRQHTEGQLNQHKGIADAVKQVPQLVSGITDISRRAGGASGTAMEDRDVITDPIDTLTVPWTTPGIEPAGSSDPSVAFEPVEGFAVAGRPFPLTLVVRGIESGAFGVVFEVSGPANISLQELQVQGGGSTAECDVNGREAVCGITLTMSENGVASLTAKSGSATATVTVFTNLVVNGGFEDGLSAPWGTGIYEPRPQGIFWGAAEAEAAVVGGGHSGGRHLQIVNRSPVKGNIYRTLSQKVQVAGKADHCFTVWVRTENGTGGMLTFRLNDSWGEVLGTQAGSPEWRQYAHSFVTEDNNIDVRIVSENTGTAHIDDLVLTPGRCKVPNGVVANGAAAR